MRKGTRTLICLLLTGAVILSLTGCASREVEAADDEIVIAVTVNSKDDIFQTGLEYSADGMFCGGMACSNADGSPQEDGETRVFRFDPSCFRDGILPSEMTVAVMLSGSHEYLDIQSLAERTGFCEPCESGPFPVEAGTVYRFLMSGSFSEGFELTPVT